MPLHHSRSTAYAIPASIFGSNATRVCAGATAGSGAQTWGGGRRAHLATLRCAELAAGCKGHNQAAEAPSEADAQIRLGMNSAGPQVKAGPDTNREKDGDLQANVDGISQGMAEPLRAKGPDLQPWTQSESKLRTAAANGVGARVDHPPASCGTRRPQQRM